MLEVTQMWKRDALPQPAGDPPLATSGHASPPGPTRIESRPVEKVVLDLGKSVMIKGELSASEDLTLCGQMEGRVTLSDHTLTVGPDADIRAEIVANAVVVTGSVTGSITAGKRVEIRATGSVKGDVVSPDLVIHEGGRLQGKVDMYRPPAP
jgi:cytoskeletal protein CcmA (bactofilin family)